VRDAGGGNPEGRFGRECTAPFMTAVIFCDVVNRDDRQCSGERGGVNLERGETTGRCLRKIHPPRKPPTIPWVQKAHRNPRRARKFASGVQPQSPPPRIQWATQTAMGWGGRTVGGRERTRDREEHRGQESGVPCGRRVVAEVGLRRGHDLPGRRRRLVGRRHSPARGALTGDGTFEPRS